MNWLDWTIIAIYTVGLIALSVYIGKKQKDKADYYLGGNEMPFWSIGISTMTTQCSTNSLLGAPAFVIVVAGCLVTFASGYTISLFAGKTKTPDEIKELIWTKNAAGVFSYRKNWKKYSIYLALYSVFIIAVCFLIQSLAT